jgi:hypothetical protein
VKKEEKGKKGVEGGGRETMWRRKRRRRWCE